MLYETRFLIALLATLIIEVPILFVLVKLVFRAKKLSAARIIFTGIAASILTLPYLWFVLPPYISSNYYIPLAECLVFLAEALIYSQFLELKLPKALAISFICNLTSFLLGLIIF